MVSLNEILKISDIQFQYQISQVYYVSLKRLPIIYTRLYSAKKLSIEEYSLIKRLWNSKSFCIKEEIHSMLNQFFGSKSISKSQRNSFDSSIKKLVKYGLIVYKKQDFKTISISLSSNIFSKVHSYYNRYLRNVDLFYLVYMGNISQEQFYSYLDLCEEAGVEPLKMSHVIRIERTPVIGLRSPIIGLREPIIDIRKPIINHKSNEYFPNKKKNRINFNAKKYEGLTENEKKQLESYARFGMDYVERKLRQMRKNQVVIANKLEIDCIDNFVPYYENLICKTTGAISYTLLTNQKKKLSRHWTAIFKCYQMCIERGYDWKIYLDAQFDSFKNWNTTNFRYPVPNMLCTERAINAYENYIYHNETSYQNEGWETKVSSKDVGDYVEEMTKILKTDLGIITNVVNYSLKKSFNKTFKHIDKSRKDLEKLYYSVAVQQSWEDLSIEFWSFVPQMSEFLDRMYGNYVSLDAKIDLYQELIGNSRKVEIIREVCKEVGIPMIYGIFEVDEKMKE